MSAVVVAVAAVVAVLFVVVVAHEEFEDNCAVELAKQEVRYYFPRLAQLATKQATKLACEVQVQENSLEPKEGLQD